MTEARVVALCGGVGGAKLALGLYRLLPQGMLSVIVNTGDDFEHLGLSISPDLDTVLYTLADLAHPHNGWGRRDETWHFMDVLQTLRSETWFMLGDRDLALHVERTRRLRQGESLSFIMAMFAERFGIAADIVPMTDQSVRTWVTTDAGPLAFQDYFVRRRCTPKVINVQFRGADSARMALRAHEVIASSATAAIILCPSNPYLSIDPILAVSGMRSALQNSPAPVIAVCPIVGGEAIKGPTAKIMRGLGIEAGPQAIARHYAEFLDGLVCDLRDEAHVGALCLPVHFADTLMNTVSDKIRLSETVLEFAQTLTPPGSRSVATP
jgi:LPPG:FO 2-phospho-L-lactate transferase